MAKGKLTLGEAQEKALEFTRDFLSKTPLGLPATMSEDDFKNTMDAITRGVGSAWIAGWLEGSR